MLAVLLTAYLICNAQYNNYFNPYLYAAITTGTDEVYRLNNIRFDENAIKQNPKAWDSYLKYMDINKNLSKKSNTYGIISCVGLSVICSSFIPTLLSLRYDYDDPRSDAALNWGLGLLCVGSATSLIGGICWAVQLDRIKANKKDFIYYLKTTNNGIGIVTIF